jgi:hypothetical protein
VIAISSDASQFLSLLQIFKDLNKKEEFGDGWPSRVRRVYDWVIVIHWHGLIRFLQHFREGHSTFRCHTAYRSSPLLLQTAVENNVGRLGSRLRGYHPVAPRPKSCRPFVHRLLVPPVIFRGAPRHATWETSVSEGRNYGWEMTGNFGLLFRPQWPTSTAKRNSRYNQTGQCSKKRVGCSCGENGGQLSRKDRQRQSSTGSEQPRQAEETLEGKSQRSSLALNSGRTGVSLKRRLREEEEIPTPT